MIRRRTLLAASAAATIQAKKAPYRLIAHRGVHSERIAENSAGAIEEAIRRGYWMVELDLRQTADGEIAIIHDQNLKRSAGLDAGIAAVPWSRLREIRVQPGNERLLRFREAAELARGRIQIWIDIKDTSVTPEFLEHVEGTLKENSLHEEAIIGIHSQATPFFQGRIRTARTIQDLFFQHRNRVDIAQQSILCEGIGFTLSNESVKWAIERHVPGRTFRWLMALPNWPSAPAGRCSSAPAHGSRRRPIHDRFRLRTSAAERPDQMIRNPGELMILKKSFHILVVLMSFVTVPASAQSTLSAIVGIVKDPAGLGISEAEISVTAESTGVARKFRSLEDGSFRLSPLNTGQYSITISKAGFHTLTQLRIVVGVASTVRLDLSLTLGETATSVQVEGEAPLLQTDETSVGGTVTADEMSRLPVNGRNYTRLVVLMPGTSNQTKNQEVGGFSGTGSYSVNGQRAQDNNYTLNGIENNVYAKNSPGASPPMDSIQEMRILTGGSAEFGRSAGADVNMVGEVRHARSARLSVRVLSQ